MVKTKADPYKTSKHALEALAPCLRDEWHPFGATVPTMSPSLYENGLNDRDCNSYKQWFDEEIAFKSKSN